MKAFWIKSTEATIEEVEYFGLPDLQRMVGGYIELAHLWPDGDTVYVDEEGRLREGPNPRPGFRLADQAMWHAGNGVVVGREIGRTERTYDPKITLADLFEVVLFGELFL